MKSRWNDAAAAACGNALQLRAYTSRLLGGDAALVLHGGGNTSLKHHDPHDTHDANDHGEPLLYVKATGRDLAHVDEHAFTPLRLASVLPLVQRPHLDNIAMMQALERCCVTNPAPKPSIETLMHAGLPFRHVEHTHADAVLAALNVDTIEAVHAEVYGERAPLVPYHHSGHALARACIEAYTTRGTPRTIGLILAFHGVVAFADDARAAYEHMIELVTRAEDFLKAHHAWTVAPPALAKDTVAAAADEDALPALHRHIEAVAGVPLVLHRVSDDASRAFAQRADLARITQQGPATPQHAVFTKRVPLIDRDVDAYAARYRRYLDQHLGQAAGRLIDAAPRIVLDPHWGLCAFGTSEREARIAAQMYQHDIGIIARASAHANYRSAPAAAIAQAEFEYGGHAAKAL